MARIAFLLPDFRTGGAERVALTLIDEFVKRGIEVDLVLLRAEGDLLEHLPAGVEVVSLEASRFRHAIRPMAAYLRRRQPDAVQARMWPLTIAAILARILARSKTRLVVSDHGIMSKHYQDSPLALAALRLTTPLYALADARISISDGVAADMARLSGLDRARFTVIRNPVPQFPEGTTESQVEQLWRGRGRRILTVGSLKADKNHALLVRALARVEGNTQLMILGEGTLRLELEKLGGELGVADRLILPGLVADPRPFYKSADLFALSSDHEGYGNVILEALRAGLPVISTDCPSGPREILDDGRYGRLVPMNDPVAFADAITAALAEAHDPEPGRRRVRELSDDAVERYEAVLLGPISGSP